MYFDQGSRSLKTLVLTVFPKRAGSSWEVKLTRDFEPRALPGIPKLPILAIFWCQNGSVIAKMLSSPKGLRAESARAFTGRRCPHSGRGEDFLTGQLNFFTETAVTPERKVEKSFPRWEINRHAEG